MSHKTKRLLTRMERDMKELRDRRLSKVERERLRKIGLEVMVKVIAEQGTPEGLVNKQALGLQVQPSQRFTGIRPS